MAKGKQAQDRRGRRRHQPAGLATATSCSTSSSAGIVLQGTEVKALRDGTAQLKDGYAVDPRRRAVAAQRPHPALRARPARENHEPERPRKLLLHRREIERLIGATSERGLTLVPTRIYFNGPAREGRDRAGARQGPLRQARVDQGARDAARHASARCATRSARSWPARRLAAASPSVRCRCVASMPSTSTRDQPEVDQRRRAAGGAA